MTAITLPRAELEQWLEALLFVNWSELDKVEGVITALRERLAQPEQESFSPEAISATQAAWKAEQPEQEPVQFKCTVIDDAHPNGIPLEQWAKPPQREWVDLTPKEIEACRQEGYLHSGLNAPFDFDRAAGAVLAKAKEKNT